MYEPVVEDQKPLPLSFYEVRPTAANRRRIRFIDCAVRPWVNIDPSPGPQSNRILQFSAKVSYNTVNEPYRSDPKF